MRIPTTTFIPHIIVGNDSFLRGYSIYYNNLTASPVQGTSEISTVKERSHIANTLENHRKAFLKDVREGPLEITRWGDNSPEKKFLEGKLV